MSLTSSIDSLTDMIRCGICGNIFEDPWNLSCSHTFCRECIAEKLIHDDQTTGICCPTCCELSYEEELHPNAIMADLAAKHHDSETRSEENCYNETNDEAVNSSTSSSDWDVSSNTSQENYADEILAADYFIVSKNKWRRTSEPIVLHNLHNSLKHDQYMHQQLPEVEPITQIKEETDVDRQRRTQEIKGIKSKIANGKSIFVQEKTTSAECKPRQLCPNSQKKQLKSVQDILFPKKKAGRASKEPTMSLKQFDTTPQKSSQVSLKSFSPRLRMHNERLWLPCPTENVIQVYNRLGKLEKTITSEEIRRPVSLVHLNTGDLVVACDSNNGLVQLDDTGKFKTRISEGSFSQVTAVGSLVYCLNYKLCTVITYRFHGGKTWSEMTSWPLTYQNGNNCDSIHACNNSIYISSWWNKCIFHYTTRGALIAQYGGDQGIVTDSKSKLQQRRNTVCLASMPQQDHSHVDSDMKRPRVSAADACGRLLVSDTDGHCVYILEAGHWHSLPIDNCRSPYDVAVDVKNKCLWLLGEYGLRLQQLTY